jgi:hypothetical protein
VATDLQDERAKRNFDNEKGLAFVNIMDKKNYFASMKDLKAIIKDPVLCNSHKFYEMTREEMWIDHMKKFRRAWDTKKNEWFVDYNT